MSLIRHPFVVLGLILGGLGLLAMLAPIEQMQQALAPFSDDAQTRFGRERSVGQTFVPLPGVREIRMPVGRAPEAKGPLILHLRSEYFGDDVRTAVIFEPQPETEDMVFRFSPYANPPPKLMWVLEAPHGPRDAYWVYREQDASAFSEGTALVVGEPLRGNFGFTQVGVDRAYRRVGEQLVDSFTSWEKQSLVLFVLGVVGFLIFRPWLTRWLTSSETWLPVLVGLTVVLHAWMAMQLPIIIDEGAYLQDAWQARLDFLPLRDFLTKGPVYVGLLKIWQALAPATFPAWRLLSALSWGGVTWLSFLLARRLGMPRPVPVLAAVMLAVLPTAIAPTTPLLLQVTSTLVVVSGLWMALKGAQEDRWSWVAASGAMMVAGYLTRASSVAVALAAGLAILIYARRRWRLLGVYIASGLLLLVLITLGALAVMGPARTAIMLNVEAAVVGTIQTSRAGGVEPILRWLTQASLTFWRGGAWMVAGLLLLPLAWVVRWPRWLRLLGLVGWFLLVSNMIWHLTDMGYGLPGNLFLQRVTMLTVAFGIPLVWLLHALWIRQSGGGSRLGWRTAAVLLAWAVALVVVYRSWGVFRASYIVEFLPPAAMLSAAGLMAGFQRLGRRGLSQAVLIGLFLAGWWQGMSLALAKPISGTITVEAAEAVGHLVRREVPLGEGIFTAQPVVTAAAGRAIVRGYAHPGWIRAERVGGIPPGLRAIYFADEAEITRWLDQEVRFVVTDERTSEIYFDDFPQRQAILKEKFELVGEVPNDLTEEPFRLYERRDPTHTQAESG